MVSIDTFVNHPWRLMTQYIKLHTNDIDEKRYSNTPEKHKFILNEVKLIKSIFVIGK